MTNKIIIAGLVALAFVTGSIMTTSMAYAADKPNGQPFQALWNAIDDLESELENIELTPGPQGEPGPAGFSNLYIVEGETQIIPSIGSASLQVQCDEGDLATGGGWFTTTAPQNIMVSTSIPQSDGWAAVVSTVPDLGFEVNGNARVICADVSEPFRP